MEVLPAIIEDSFQEIKRKIELVAFVDWIQIDIGDGKFVAHETWTRIEDLNTLDIKLNVDLHAMVADPLAFVARATSVVSIRRITFHYEAVTRHEGVIREMRGTGRDVGVAINPETMVERIVPLLGQLDAVLVMGVHPGWGGQQFIPETCDTIRALKQAWPQGRVGVDGGVHLAIGSAQAAVDAGADFLVVGSDIFGAPNLEEAIRRLQQLRNLAKITSPTHPSA